MLHKASIVTGIAAAAALAVAPMAQAAGNGHYGNGGQGSKPYTKFNKDDAFSNNNINFGDQYCDNSQGTEGGIKGTVLGAVTETVAPVLGTGPQSNKGNEGQVLSPQTNACINGSNNSNSAVGF